METIKDYVYKELPNIARIETIKVSENLSTDGELNQQTYTLRLPAATTRQAFEVVSGIKDLKVNYNTKYKMTLLVRYVG